MVAAGRFVRDHDLDQFTCSRLSSSPQFWTTTIVRRVAGVSAASVTMRNRFPSAVTSYCGRGDPLGATWNGSRNSSTGGPTFSAGAVDAETANDDLRVEEWPRRAIRSIHRNYEEADRSVDAMTIDPCSATRHDTKGLPALDSVDREIRTIRREHGRAVELFSQCDERGIRKIHRQIGILVE